VHTRDCICRHLRCCKPGEAGEVLGVEVQLDSVLSHAFEGVVVQGPKDVCPFGAGLEELVGGLAVRGDDVLHPDFHRVGVRVDLDGGHLTLVLAEEEVERQDAWVRPFGEGGVLPGVLAVAVELALPDACREDEDEWGAHGSSLSVHREPARRR